MLAGQRKIMVAIYNKIQSKDFYFSKGRLFLYFYRIFYSPAESFTFLIDKKGNQKNQTLWKGKLKSSK